MSIVPGGRLPQEEDTSARRTHDSRGLVNERVGLHTAVAGMAGYEATRAVSSVQGKVR